MIMSRKIHPVANFFEIIRHPKGNVPGAVIEPSAGPCKYDEQCQGCGYTIERNQWEGATATATGKLAAYWPDHAGFFYLIFSQRVIDALSQIGATGYIAHPLLVEVTPKPDEHCEWLLSNEPPNYYWLEITGRVDIERNVFDGGDGNLCTVCHRWRPRPGGKAFWGDKPRWPLVDSWGGSDFVKSGNILGGQACSRRVLELALSEQWTGFDFKSFMPRMPLGDIHQPGWFERYNEELHRRIPWPQDEMPWWEKEKQATQG